MYCRPANKQVSGVVWYASVVFNRQSTGDRTPPLAMVAVGCRARPKRSADNRPWLPTVPRWGWWRCDRIWCLVRDPHLLPKVQSIQAGRLKIGDGRNQVDVSYVDDVVAAHLNALDALATQPQQVGGQAYYISQDQPVYLWDWLNCILSGLGHPPLKRRVPLPIAYAAGSACELLWGLLRKRSDPPMTRFVAVELAKSHYFDISAAKQQLGFRPRVDMETALARTVDDLRQRGYALN